MRAPLSFLALMLLAAVGCGVELEHGLDERQANQVAAALERADLAPEQQPPGDGKRRARR